MTDPYVGKLTFFRVYSGVLAAGSYIYNSTKDKKERIGRLLQMHANKREEIEEVRAGDIAAAIGLKDTKTGRSEEHTSELQSHHDLVCRLLLEKKKKQTGTSRSI